MVDLLENQRHPIQIHVGYELRLAKIKIHHVTLWSMYVHVNLYIVLRQRCVDW